jgi:hypothetical protein
MDSLLIFILVILASCFSSWFACLALAVQSGMALTDVINAHITTPIIPDGIYMGTYSNSAGAPVRIKLTVTGMTATYNQTLNSTTTQSLVTYTYTAATPPRITFFTSGAAPADTKTILAMYDPARKEISVTKDTFIDGSPTTSTVPLYVATFVTPPV